MDKRNIFQRLFGFCPQCRKWFRIVKTERQNTAYVDDSQNWFTGCKKCRIQNDENWAEMWNDYYSHIGGCF